MKELHAIRRRELVFILLAFIIYVTRRLWTEITLLTSEHLFFIDGEYKEISSSLIRQDIEGFSLVLHTIFPIAGALLLFASWYVFHYLTFPKIEAKEWNNKALLYLGLTIFLVMAGVFIFHYFKRYTELKLDKNVITDVKTYSLYRKKTIIADMAAVLIILGLYELFMQTYYYLHLVLSSEKEKYWAYLSNFLFGCLMVVALVFALIGGLSTPLAAGKLYMVIIGGLILLIYILQYFLYHYLLPIIPNFFSSPFTINFIVFLSLCFAGSLFLWLLYTDFKIHQIESIPFFFLIAAFTSIVIAYLRRVFSKEKILLQTQVSAKSAELSSLRSQVNPHFLFNALNSLYSTALKENSEKTAEGIQKLGDMMRFMLHENNQDRILLQKEIEYLHNYIQIQSMRLDESQKIEIRVNIQEPDKAIYIAPMMLNPFVENAFKHGISFRNPSWIYITLTLDATKLFFKVHNSLHPAQKKDPEEEKSKVGLENVKKRLELIYPNRHSLDIQQSERDYFIALTLHYW